MNEINNLINKFENNLINAPTISNIWIEFLKNKLYKLEKIIYQANLVLENINDYSNLTIEQVILINYLIHPQNI